MLCIQTPKSVPCDEYLFYCSSSHLFTCSSAHIIKIFIFPCNPIFHAINFDKFFFDLDKIDFL